MTLAAVASFSVGRASRSSTVTWKVSLILAKTGARHPKRASYVAVPWTRRDWPTTRPTSTRTTSWPMSRGALASAQDLPRPQSEYEHVQLPAVSPRMLNDLAMATDSRGARFPFRVIPLIMIVR